MVAKRRDQRKRTVAAPPQWPCHDPFDLWHQRRGIRDETSTASLLTVLCCRWLRWHGHVQRTSFCIKVICPDGVYNPDNIRDRACAVLHSRWAGHPICDPSRIIATWFSYCSINPLRPPNCICLQSDRSFLYKLNCNLFNHHARLHISLHRPASAIRHFFWLVVIAGGGRQRNQSRDCAMTWAFHVLQNICRIKISWQFISTFGRNMTISLEN